MVAKDHGGGKMIQNLTSTYSLLTTDRHSLSWSHEIKNGFLNYACNDQRFKMYKLNI